MSNELMNNYDVVKKLIGPIEPVGETNTDEKRYENLEATIILVDRLLSDLYSVSSYNHRFEWSMQKAGKKAEEFLKGIKYEF